MQRCPVCNARLSGATLCPRCGADLSRIQTTEHLAKQWLGVALHSLRCRRTDVAVSAVLRAASFKQSPAARLLKGFLVQQLYRTLYDDLAKQHWQDAHNTLNHLRRLHGQNETLARFDEMIVQLSSARDRTIASNFISPDR